VPPPHRCFDQPAYRLAYAAEFRRVADGANVEGAGTALSAIAALVSVVTVLSLLLA